MPRRSSRRSTGRSPAARRSRSSAMARKRAIGRAAQWDATLDLSGAVRRHALRAGGAGALGEGRHAARRDRGAGGGKRPGAGLRADGLRAASRRGGGRRHDRRRARGEPLRAAAHQGRRGARSFPRRQRRFRARRDLQVRRPRGQERHRLRPLQASRRLLGHARGDDRRDGQDAAARRDRRDRPGAAASTMRRRRSSWRR